MMRATTCLLPLLCALAAYAAPAPGVHNYAKRVIHSQRARPGKGFEIVPFVDQVKDDQILTMAVRLTQSNPEGLESALADISNPDSPRYGQWLSREQIAAFTRPTDETFDAVTRWLAKNGLNATRSELPEYITFTVPVGQANNLLDAKYAAFINSNTGDRLVRTLQYSIPEAMEQHIKTIYPGTSFFNPRAMPFNAVRRLTPPAAKTPDSETIPVIIARANETLTLTVSQLTTLWDAVQNQRSGKTSTTHKRAALAQLSSVPALNSSLLVSSVFPSLSGVEKRQESPEEILRKLNETLGGTLPTGTRIVQVPDTGDLSGLDPALADIIRGIVGGQNVPQVPVPAPSQPPRPTVTITVTETSSSTPTPSTTQVPVPPSSSSSSTPVPPVQTDIPIPVARPGLTDPSCATEITPACLQQLYSIPQSLDVPQGPVGIAVTGYIDQYGQHEDLQKYLKEFRTDVDPSLTFETVSIAGGINPQDGGRAGVEANLDLQYTIGVTPGIPVQFVTVGKSGTGNGFLDTITTMIAQQDVPEVVTTSYGQIEQDVDVDVAEAMCDAYKQLTARGVSILFASGDSGVGDFTGDCLADGIFEPTFPSGCPFITSVGSTDGVAPERAASFSSGGFSRHYPMPAFQQAHVQRYLKAHEGLHAGRFNPSGRAFPDVSLQGTKYAVVNGGEKILVQGTSASCPVFASMIALINAERHAVGMPPMGFLNPWLYGKASPAFIDITRGSNPNCGTEGFPAAPGWDPVTGLGTPSFISLRAAAGLQ